MRAPKSSRAHSLQPSDLGLTFDDLQSTPTWIVGIDEVGLGCCAGPLVAAAVAYRINPAPQFEAPVRITDSKILSEPRRDEATQWIAAQTEHLFFEIEESSPAEIDRVNVLKASHLAMSRAWTRLQAKLPELSHSFCVLIDGSRLPREFSQMKAATIVKGDAKSFPIAAASIVAKVYRDRLMEGLSQLHPQYGWSSNVGYPTPDHKEAIARFGYTEWHRRSYSLKLPDVSPLAPEPGL